MRDWSEFNSIVRSFFRQTWSCLEVSINFIPIIKLPKKYVKVERMNGTKWRKKANNENIYGLMVDFPRYFYFLHEKTSTLLTCFPEFIHIVLYTQTKIYTAMAMVFGKHKNKCMSFNWCFHFPLEFSFRLRDDFHIFSYFIFSYFQIIQSQNSE